MATRPVHWHRGTAMHKGLENPVTSVDWNRVWDKARGGSHTAEASCRFLRPGGPGVALWLI